MTVEASDQRKAKQEEEHRQTILAHLRRNLKLLEEHVADITDPTRMDTQVIYDLMLLRIQVARGSNELKPGDKLTALDGLENWYTSQGIAYPYPETLARQREYWINRENEKPA